MRQAGILAAAGLYALEHHLERLGDDHLHAQQLAAGLEALGLHVEPKPQTNMVFFEIGDAPAFRQACAERDLLVNTVFASRFRAVTHLDVGGADIEDALGRIGEVLALGIR
jgi:threonine aldolase